MQTSWRRIALVSSLSLVVVACADERPPAPKVHADHQDLGVPELPRLSSRLLPYVPHLTARPKAAPPGLTARVSGPRRIVQKTLLLTATGDEPSFLAAKSSLDRMGVPYRAVIVTEETLTASMLSDDVSTCYFNSVIFATSGLAYYDATAGWQSALTTAQWAAITDFELACSAREAIWYAWPSADLGLAYSSSLVWTDTVTAVVTTPGFFSDVRSTAAIPVRYAAGYRASLADTATISLLEDQAGGVLLALHTGSDGRQFLVQTFDQSPYLVHTLALEYDLVNWVTGGMFVGKKRAYMTAQIDDIFIDADMWVAGVGNDGSVQFRITGTDITALEAWQSTFTSQLPAGSTFQPVFAFNGEGTRSAMYSDQSLLPAATHPKSAFLWLSHTWDHENMDAMTYNDAFDEARRNITLARKHKLFGFSAQELVTPDVSGLDNADALAGIADAGVRYVVSNTSITEAMHPENPGTNPSFNVGRTNPIDDRIYQVPRHPTNIFYDVATPANETDEYNFRYHSYYGRDLTYAEVVDKDSEFGLFYLMQGDIDPLMFHQSNTANYNAGTTARVQSLYGDWAEAAAGKFLALSPAPILTLRQSDIAAAMEARGAFDECGATATIVESTLGTRNLELHATAACTVPVTGLSAAGVGSVETYLGAPTTSIALAAGQTKSVALP